MLLWWWCWCCCGVVVVLLWCCCCCCCCCGGGGGGGGAKYFDVLWLMRMAQDWVALVRLCTGKDFRVESTLHGFCRQDLLLSNEVVRIVVL